MKGTGQNDIVITGIGLIAPTGNDLDTFWTSLLTGRSAIRRITSFDPAPYPCQIGGEVKDSTFAHLVSPRQLRTTTRSSQLLIAAVTLAMKDAGLRGGEYAPWATGVVIGTALAGWRDGERQYGILLERGVGRVNPFIANGAAYHVPAAE